MKKLITFLTVFMLFATLVSAQNEKFKAIFMYNFTKNIEWPAAYRSGDFVIGVLGNSPITKELQIIAKTKKAGSQRIAVKTYASVNSISRSHIIYIPPGKSKYLPLVLQKTQNQSTLIITDSNGLALQGAGINYIRNGNKTLFEINKNNIASRGLKVSSTLLRLGVPVK